MSNAQHTLGPWISEPFNELTGEIEIIGTETDPNDGQMVPAFVAATHSEANARLIAAAPDLLEALEVLLASSQDGAAYAVNSLAAIQVEVAAILKAKGEEA